MKTFVVIGLGRFGVAVATELSALGHEVLALDGAEENVQKVADTVTHAVTGDARDPAVLRALGVRNYDCAIVAVGDDMGNSALITLNLKEILGSSRSSARPRATSTARCWRRSGPTGWSSPSTRWGSSWRRGCPAPTC